jgi:hypothetical protein
MAMRGSHKIRAAMILFAIYAIDQRLPSAVFTTSICTGNISFSS